MAEEFVFFQDDQPPRKKGVKRVPAEEMYHCPPDGLDFNEEEKVIIRTIRPPESVDDGNLEAEV